MGTQFFWFYDILLIAVVLGVTFRCYRKGFVAVFLGFLAVVLSFAGALYMSEPAAEQIYKSFIEETVHDYAEDSSNGILDDNILSDLYKLDISKITVSGKSPAEFDLTPDPAGKITLDLTDTDLSATGIEELDFSSVGIDVSGVDFSNIDGGRIIISAGDFEDNNINSIVLAETLTEVIRDSSFYGGILKAADDISAMLPRFGGEDEGRGLVTDFIVSSVGSEAGNLQDSFINGLVKPIIMTPLRTVIFFILFVILSLILSLIVRMTRFVNRIPVIGGVNRIFGGVTGVLEAAVIVFLICIIINIIISVTGNNIVFLNSVTINETLLFKHIYSLDFLNFS